MFAAKPGRAFEDAYRARKDGLEQWTEIADRVADLLVRMDTAEAELAATAHFACTGLCDRLGELPTEAAVIDEVLE